MQPTEKGGILLENSDEIVLALNTLSASTLDMGIGLSDPAEMTERRQLRDRVLKAATARAETLELSNKETPTLRNACQVATANYHYSLGIMTCFQVMTGVPEHMAEEVMSVSSNRLFERASIIVHTGHSDPLLLAGMLSIYGPQQPTGE